jgi:MFS family permease
VGGLAVLLQDELGFGEPELGVAIAGFFAAAALAAAPAGRLSEVLGPRAVARVGVGCIVASLLGVALLADSWVFLGGLMALAGLGHALALLAVGVLLTRAVSASRHGLAFGLTQAAAPLAALLAGLSVPVIGLTLGWQAAFILGAGLGIMAGLLMPPVPDRPRVTAGMSDRDAPVRVLMPLAIAMGLASAGGNSAVVFLVTSTVDNGFSAASAGLVLAVASVVGLTVRITGGWLGDRLPHGSLLLMSSVIATGAIGYVGLAMGQVPAVVILSATLAFGGGWGWPGLMLLAVSRTNPAAPGDAMGIVTVGGLGGAVIGPIAFGAITDAVSFAAAWLLMAFLALGAVLMIALTSLWLARVRPGLRP